MKNDTKKEWQSAQYLSKPWKAITLETGKSMGEV
jgi:hypothetical protein